MTYFSLPDLRGRTPIGSTVGAGEDLSFRMLGDRGGSTSVTLTAANLPRHNHAYEGTATAPVGSGQAYDNMKPYLAITAAVVTEGNQPGWVRFFAFDRRNLSSSLLPCNGLPLAISSYGTLYSHLGTNFGGNGVTTFALPDLQGRTSLGAGAGSGLTSRVPGAKGGSETTTLTVAQLAAHNHTYETGTTDSTGGGETVATMQPFTVLRAVLATTGFYGGSNALPAVGEVRLVASNAEISSLFGGGFVVCDGQALSISEYSSLFTSLGTTYGGDGSSTFKVPDLQGRVSLHQGAVPGGATFNLGEKAGSETLALTVEQLPAHAHNLIASAVQFEVAAPSSVQGAEAFTVTVTVIDENGNIATGYTGTVRFTSTDAGATLPANYTFVAGDGGVHTFSVTLTTGGAQALTVTDVADSAVTGVSSSITVDVDDPAVVTASGGTTAFVEGNSVASTPVAIDAGLTLSDPDSATLASATVSITGNFQSAQDVLAFADDGASMGNITASYHAGTGVLTLTSAGASATLAQWQAALRSVRYSNSSQTPSTATRTISFTVNDGTSNSNTATKSVNVTSVNDAPLVSAPGSIAVTEDAASALTGISFSDTDSGSSSVTATFATGSGTLVATSGGGVTVNGSGTGTLTLTGSIANLNAFVGASNLTFTTAANATSDVTLTVGINDGGNTGGGGAQIGSASVTLQPAAVNDAPVITAPISIIVSEDETTPLTGISFADDDAGNSEVSVTYSVVSGVLVADGQDRTSLTLIGTLQQMNELIAGGLIGYRTNTNATGNAVLTIQINDGGNTGSGGAKTDVTTLTMVVTAVNDAPVNSVPSTQTVDQDGVLVFSSGNGNRISVSDVDAGNGTVRATLTATHGLLTLPDSTGLVFVSGDGIANSTMTFEGTLNDINLALNGLLFMPTGGYHGPATLQVVSNDLGLSGSGGSQTDTDTIAIDVRAPEPEVTSVNVTNPDGSYQEGDTLSVTVTFDIAATVDTTGGVPTLRLDTGAVDRLATYVAGSGTNTLAFSYVVQAGDHSADLDYASTDALTLNGATIRSATGLDALLTLPATGGTSSIAGQRDIVVDGLAPSVASITRTGTTPTNASSIGFTVTFSEPVTGVNASDFALTTSGTAAGTIGSLSTADNITYTLSVNAVSGAGTLRLDLKASGTGIIDGAGNGASGGFTSGQTYTLDTVAPAAPVIAGISADTGASGADGVTSDTTLTFAGTAEANSAVQVFLNAGSLGTTAANGAGEWSFDHTGTTLSDGAYAMTARAVDAAGNASSASAVFTIMIDTVAPAAPAVTAITDDTGVSSTDRITSDTTLVLTGTAAAGSTVTVSDADSGVLGSITANGSGLWTFDHTGTTLAAGAHTFTATSADAAGNVSPESAAFAVTIQTPPAIVSQPVGGVYVAGDTITLSVTATGDGPLSYQWYLGGAALGDSSNRSGSTSATMVLTGVGTIGFAGDYTVVVTNVAGPAVTSSAATVVVNKMTQTVDFPPIADKLVADEPFAISATASSGFVVTFSVVSGPATISGNVVTITGAGEVTIRASQAGDLNVEEAFAEQSFTVDKLPQTITFAELADRSTTDAPISLSATATSGLPVSFALVSGPATLSGDTLTLTGTTGTVVVTASQAGDDTYLAAASVTGSFAVAAVGPQVFFGTTDDHDAIAANLAQDNSTGTIIGYLAAVNQGFVLTFTPTADGAFSGTARTFAGVSADAASELVVQAMLDSDETSVASAKEDADTSTIARAVSGETGALTFNGTVLDGVMTGIIEELGLAFTLQMQPQTGPSADVAGYYRAAATNTASGEVYAIVGTQNLVYVLALTDEALVAGTATLAPDRTFSLAPSAEITLTGSLGTGKQTLTGGLAIAGEIIPFVGTSSTTAPTDRLLNLSSRAHVGTSGEQILIAGFVIGGSEPKSVLLRAAGPSLAKFGVAQPLAAPRLRLYDQSGQLLREVAGWGGDLALANLFAAVGAFAFDADSADAALVASLAPGVYTMHVTGDGATGVALAEVYDASADGTQQRLLNISSRGPVSSGDAVLIGGFVVGGNMPKRVLIRGIGPGLAAHGVAAPLADPTLTLYSGGDVIARNDNWEAPVVVNDGQTAATAGELAEASTAAGAFSLAAGSTDAALIVTLAPGAYTVHVGSGNGTTGIALVEVYEIPE